MTQLVTAKSILRAPTPADAPSLARHANNRNIWLNVRDVFPHPYTEDDARAFIQRNLEQDPRTLFLIEVDGEAAGAVGLYVKTDVERISAEIGYWLGEELWGRGIVTEAVEAVTDYGFSTLGLKRIFATTAARNTASCRVLEKAGYEREALMRNAAIKDGEIIDMFLYARTP